MKIFVDVPGGFIGTKVQSGFFFECTNFDKILLFFEDGTYFITPIEDKRYIYQGGSKLIWAGVADKKTPFTVVYYQEKTGQLYLKRFVVEKFILDKTYRYLDNGAQLQSLTTFPSAKVDVELKPKAKQKTHHIIFKADSVAVKAVAAKGVRITDKEVEAVSIDAPINISCINQTL
jgi:topoisomerase-4 subunit A